MVMFLTSSAKFFLSDYMYVFIKKKVRRKVRQLEIGSGSIQSHE